MERGRILQRHIFDQRPSATDQLDEVRARNLAAGRLPPIIGHPTRAESSIAVDCITGGVVIQSAIVRFASAGKVSPGDEGRTYHEEFGFKP